jgi:hypothetical protein
VRGGAPAVEEAGLREQERAGAHRGHPARAPCDAAYPADDGPILRGLVDAGPTRHDQRVDGPRGVREVAIHHEPEAAPGANGPRRRGDHLDLITLVGLSRETARDREHLHRPGDVERLDPGGTRAP